MISSYTDLMLRIQSMVTGDELVDASGLNINTLRFCIASAEFRIYREVRSRYNEKAFTAVTVTNNLAPLPADFESASVVHFGKKALVPVAETWLMEFLQSSPSGDAEYFAEAGSNLTFGPGVADGTAVQGRYFYRLEPLDETTFANNDLIQREPDLFVYAACVEAAPEFSKDETISFWNAKYEAIRERVNLASTRAAHNVGRITVRPSTLLMG